MRGALLLKRYLKVSRTTFSALAEAAGLDTGQMSRCLAGKRGLSIACAVALEQATDGAVPVSSWAAPRRPSRRPAA
jgi:plasmid maintenance system antidote protein VapI